MELVAGKEAIEVLPRSRWLARVPRHQPGFLASPLPRALAASLPDTVGGAPGDRAEAVATALVSALAGRPVPAGGPLACFSVGVGGFLRLDLCPRGALVLLDEAACWREVPEPGGEPPAAAAVARQGAGAGERARADARVHRAVVRCAGLRRMFENEHAFPLLASRLPEPGEAEAVETYLWQLLGGLEEALRVLREACPCHPASAERSRLSGRLAREMADAVSALYERLPLLRGSTREAAAWCGVLSRCGGVLAALAGRCLDERKGS